MNHLNLSEFGPSIRLSLEELAFILSDIGEPLSAKQLLQTHLGSQLDRDEASTRLIAAGSGMIARGYVEVDKNGVATLSRQLQLIGTLIAHPDFSLRMHHSTPAIELMMTYHFGQNLVVEHHVEHGVVHVITNQTGKDEVVNKALEFFEVIHASQFNCPEVEFPHKLLDSLKDEKDQKPVYHAFTDAGLPEEVGQLLAGDITNTRYRGACMRVDYDKNNMPVSDRGFLLLCGPERLWLMIPHQKNGESYLQTLPGDEERISKEILALM